MLLSPIVVDIEADVPKSRSFLQRTFSTLGPGSVRGSIISLAMTAVGAGMLALPSVLRENGLVLGLVMLLLAAASTLWTLRLLVACGTHAQLTAAGSDATISYPGLVRSAFGEGASKVLSGAIFFYCFGTLIGFLTVVGKSVPQVLDAFDVSSGLVTERWFILTLAASLVIFPLSLKRELAGLRYVSFFAVLSMLYVAVCLSVRYKEHAAPSSEIDMARLNLSFPQTFTLTMFTFTCHMNVPSVFLELHNPLLGSMHVLDTIRNQERRMNKVVLRATLLCLMLYGWVSLFGYLSFGRNVDDNIILAYPSGDKLMLVARMAVATALILNSPLTVHPALSILETPAASKSTLRRAGIALVYIAAATVLAIVVPNISIVFSLVGATCTTIISQVLPVALYVRLAPQEAPAGTKLNSESPHAAASGAPLLAEDQHLQQRPRAMPWKHKLAVAICALMVAISIASIVMTIKDSVE